MKEAIKNLPRRPGVYLMHGDDDGVIYVGKAKNLKNRVSQYFQSGKGHTPKVAAMVSHVRRFEYMITDTELEALVLECNLIKKYRPKYNVLLKDDKTYPYIKITVNEDFPRVFLTRRVEQDGAAYFGPYHSSYTIRETIGLVKKIFAIRSCNRVLPRDMGKERPCLNYHMNQCSAPCNGHISSEEYQKTIAEIIKFIDGNTGDTLKRLKQEMQEASESLAFEKAAKIRDKVFALEQLAQKQKITSTNDDNADVIGVAINGNTACVQIFFMRSGRILGREHFILSDIEGTTATILEGFLKEYYAGSADIPKNIIIREETEDTELLRRWLSERAESRIELSAPKRGQKLRLLEMVERNAAETLELHRLKVDKHSKKANEIMFSLQETLGLSKLPLRIESYDISHTAGKESVGVCVVYENGVPKKSAYRKFTLQSTAEGDDFGAMREVLYRRISNGIEGEEGFTPLPDLILLDGGKGQVGAVSEILAFFKCDIPLFGMVKDDKHRTRALTTQDEEIAVKRTSTLFHFLTALQDEVHRYAITAHRAKRKKAAFASELEKISGVGEVKRKKLLKHFKSMKAIKEASLEELSSVVDKPTAQRIFDTFRQM